MLPNYTHYANQFAKDLTEVDDAELKKYKKKIDTKLIRDPKCSRSCQGANIKGQRGAENNSDFIFYS